MIRNEPDSIPAPDDLLAAATNALAESPIPPGPTEEQIQRATALANHPPAARTWPRFALAASILLAAAVVYLLPRHPTALAFADVVRAVTQTHTVIGDVDTPTPLGPMQIHLSIKDHNLRFESKMFVLIANASTQKTLMYLPLLKQAQSAPFADPGFDLYNLFRRYQASPAKSLGEKQINGRRAVGFELTLPQGDIRGTDWIVWADPITHLPLEVGMPSQMIRNLRFDIPLDDSLFDTALPPGFTWGDANAALAGPTQVAAGRVLDRRGHPVANANVTIRQRVQKTGGYTYDDAAQTDADGRFTAHYSNLEGSGAANPPAINLEIKSPDFLSRRLTDIQNLSADQRAHLQLTLDDGAALTATILDDASHPVPGATVQATENLTADKDSRIFSLKTTTTDSTGHAHFAGLPAEPVALYAMKLDAHSPIRVATATIDLSTTPKPPTMILHPLTIPNDAKVRQLFGMKLIALTPAIQKQLFPLHRPGVLVLDAGPHPPQVGDTPIAEGDILTNIGSVDITTVDDLIARLLAVCKEQQQNDETAFTVFVVDFHADLGSNTNLLHLTPENLQELQQATTRPVER